MFILSKLNKWQGSSKYSRIRVQLYAVCWTLTVWRMTTPKFSVDLQMLKTQLDKVKDQQLLRKFPKTAVSALIDDLIKCFRSTLYMARVLTQLAFKMWICKIALTQINYSAELSSLENSDGSGEVVEQPLRNSVKQVDSSVRGKSDADVDKSRTSWSHAIVRAKQAPLLSKTSCKVCDGKHRIVNCERLVYFHLVKRWSTLRSLNARFQCLEVAHEAKDCKRWIYFLHQLGVGNHRTPREMFSNRRISQRFGGQKEPFIVKALLGWVQCLENRGRVAASCVSPVEPSVAGHLQQPNGSSNIRQPCHECAYCGDVSCMTQNASTHMQRPSESTFRISLCPYRRIMGITYRKRRTALFFPPNIQVTFLDLRRMVHIWKRIQSPTDLCIMFSCRTTAGSNMTLKTRIKVHTFECIALNMNWLVQGSACQSWVAYAYDFDLRSDSTNGNFTTPVSRLLISSKCFRGHYNSTKAGGSDTKKNASKLGRIHDLVRIRKKNDTAIFPHGTPIPDVDVHHGRQSKTLLSNCIKSENFSHKSAVQNSKLDSSVQINETFLLMIRDLRFWIYFDNADFSYDHMDLAYDFRQHSPETSRKAAVCLFCTLEVWPLFTSNDSSVQINETFLLMIRDLRFWIYFDNADFSYDHMDLAYDFRQHSPETSRKAAVCLFCTLEVWPLFTSNDSSVQINETFLLMIRDLRFWIYFDNADFSYDHMDLAYDFRQHSPETSRKAAVCLFCTLEVWPLFTSNDSSVQINETFLLMIRDLRFWIYFDNADFSYDHMDLAYDFRQHSPETSRKAAVCLFCTLEVWPLFTSKGILMCLRLTVESDENWIFAGQLVMKRIDNLPLIVAALHHIASIFSLGQLAIKVNLSLFMRHHPSLFQHLTFGLFSLLLLNAFIETLHMYTVTMQTGLRTTVSKRITAVVFGIPTPLMRHNVLPVLHVSVERPTNQ
ncbi:hypothetical protein CLF_108348 [Clonorchis sinensis]|uniref:Uncharacterized protein n=1 Tax=Clonorchis sinensis TaxID=79923 RepID=G7YRJ1_CLOSI|nr:hypothetical protein CLF_108348 [Clonorchis sinensis]